MHFALHEHHAALSTELRCVVPCYIPATLKGQVDTYDNPPSMHAHNLVSCAIDALAAGDACELAKASEVPRQCFKVACDGHQHQVTRESHDSGASLIHKLCHVQQ